MNPSSRASRLKEMFERFTPSKIETVSIEEHNKVKQELEQANLKVDSLKQLNEALTAENTTLLQRLNKLQGDYRNDVITALFDRINLSLEDKKTSIDSFSKSNLSFEFIAEHCGQLRDQLGRTKTTQTGESKLPQRSTTQEEEAEQEENKRMRERRNHSYID